MELERLYLSLTELDHIWTVRDQGAQSCFAVMGEQWEAAARHRPLGIWILLTWVSVTDVRSGYDILR